MRKPDLTVLLHRRLFPHPAADEPATFHNFVKYSLIPELQQETKRFYGDEPSIEAHYPGLDYSSKAHRLRLSLFPSHRRLFRAIDALRLTKDEILSVCTWEYTLRDKDNYERIYGPIKDTTWDGIEEFKTGPSPVAVVHKQARPTQQEKPGPSVQFKEPCVAEIVTPRAEGMGAGGLADIPATTHGDARQVDPSISQMHLVSASTQISRPDQQSATDHETAADEPVELALTTSGEVAEENEDEADNVISQSIGVSLNERLLEASERRARGEDAVLDAEWEQWLKEAMERNSAFDPALRGSYFADTFPSVRYLSEVGYAQAVADQAAEAARTRRRARQRLEEIERDVRSLFGPALSGSILPGGAARNGPVIIATPSSDEEASALSEAIVSSSSNSADRDGSREVSQGSSTGIPVLTNRRRRSTPGTLDPSPQTLALDAGRVEWLSRMRSRTESSMQHQNLAFRFNHPTLVEAPTEEEDMAPNTSGTVPSA